MRVFFGQLRASITREHLLRFGFSLVLATLLWGWVTDQQDPIETERFDNIEIEIPTLPSTLQVVNELSPVSVEITGPRSLLREVQPRDVGATLDIDDISESGTFRVGVNAEVPNDVREAEVTPREVEIQIEATASRNFPLTRQLPDVSNDPRTVGSVTPEVSQVTVSGPESAVNRVTRVILPIDLRDNTDDFTATFEPFAVDAQGQRIAELAILPERVSAFVSVQTSGKTVSVLPQTTGAPAEGFSVIQRTAMPQSVVVDGPPDVLSDILFVETEPIDITGRTDSLVQQIGLRPLPNGVTIVDPPSSEVEITVVIQEVGGTQDLSDQPVQVIGLDAALTARVEPGTVSVRLDVPIDLLRTMSADDVKVRVDLSGRGPGVYELRPEVTVPPGVTWISNDPQTVRIVIEPAGAGGTPTVASTPDA